MHSSNVLFGQTGELVRRIKSCFYIQTRISTKGYVRASVANELKSRVPNAVIFLKDANSVIRFLKSCNLCHLVQCSVFRKPSDA